MIYGKAVWYTWYASVIYLQCKYENYIRSHLHTRSVYHLRSRYNTAGISSVLQGTDIIERTQNCIQSWVLSWWNRRVSKKKQLITVFSPRSQPSKELKECAFERRATTMRLDRGTFDSRGITRMPLRFPCCASSTPNCQIEEKKPNRAISTVRLVVVEPTGIEPVSEDYSIQPSP